MVACSGPLNVYVLHNVMPGITVTNGTVSPGASSIQVLYGSSTWWPTSTWSGNVQIWAADASVHETVMVGSQTGSSSPYTLNLADNVVNSYTTSPVWIFMTGIKGKALLNGLAELVAWGGHYAGTTTAPGDWSRLYIAGQSSGTFPTQLIAQLGSAAYNGSNSQYTITDFNNTRLLGVMAMSSDPQLPCIGTVTGATSIKNVIPMIVGVPTATTTNMTLGPNSCATTGGNSITTNGVAYGPTGCQWGTSGCQFGTPPYLGARQIFATGGTDTTVFPQGQFETYFQLPSWQNGGMLFYPNLPHGLDNAYPGDSADYTWPPNPATGAAFQALFGSSAAEKSVPARTVSTMGVL